MADITGDVVAPSKLDRTADLTRISWRVVGIVLTLVAAIFLRFTQLAHMPLSYSESIRSFEAWALATGAPLQAGEKITTSQPLPLLLQSLSLFLFGTTDVTARVPAAMAGVGLVALAIALGRHVGRGKALAMGVLVAASPTILYASRTANPEILVAAFSLLFVVAFLRVGAESGDGWRHWRWGLVAGLALACMFASSPSWLNVVIALALGFGVTWFAERSGEGAVHATVAGIRSDRNVLISAGVTFLVATILFFSRFLSSPGSLGGIFESLADWGRLVATQGSEIPTQFFLLAVLLYELVALVFAVISVYMDRDDDGASIGWPFFLTWFIGALLLFSFSSGRSAEHAVHVALPLVLWAGIAIGSVFSRIDWSEGVRGRAIAMVVAIVGLFLVLCGIAIVLGRIGDGLGDTQPIVHALTALLLGVVPIAIGIGWLAKQNRDAGLAGQTRLLLLVALFVILGSLAWRSSIMLSFYNADQGIELLAPRTSTQAVGEMVRRTEHLSRDLTLHQNTPEDPTGGKSLSIALEDSVKWPFRWYFREFPNVVSVPDGTGAAAQTQVIFTTSDLGLESAGYAPRTYPTENGVPPAYLTPDFMNVLKHVFNPLLWREGARYLIFREIEPQGMPYNTVVGYSREVAGQLFPSTGPYSLTNSPGPGSGRGQFLEPRGIAVSPMNGNIYVVDQGNARVEAFDPTGNFLNVIGGTDGSGIALGRTDNGFGPAGVTIGPDGLVYIADTWAHQIVVTDERGQLVTIFGQNQDTQDSADPNVMLGSFFGPRAVAFASNELYVVDTGNERVQVFSPDGTPLRAIGGRGSEPGKLIEPVGIAIGPDGNIYVADSGNARISIFTPDGTPVAQWPVTAWQGQLYFEPYLAFDPAGNLYASSSVTGSVEVFDRNGMQVGSITEAEGSPLQRPYGLAFGMDGKLMIVDGGRAAVLKHDPLVAAPVQEQEIPAASPEASPTAQG